MSCFRADECRLTTYNLGFDGRESKAAETCTEQVVSYGRVRMAVFQERIFVYNLAVVGRMDFILNVK